MKSIFNIAYSSDKYQYTMGKTFCDVKSDQKLAVFNLFYRKAPDNNNWAVVSGIDESLDMISKLGCAPTDFFEKFLPGDIYKDYRETLSNLKFTGDVYSMREGEIAFPKQPIITIVAPLLEAQLLETPLLSIMNHQMVVATKASRVTRATKKPVSEFGSRRAHGPWAATFGAKAAYIGGCSGTSNIMTSYLFNIDPAGTMAHSFINSFGCSIESEYRAFDSYIKSHLGEPLILLIDTYDTLRCGIKNAIKAFKNNNITNDYPKGFGIRLDSGDLTYLSKKCREILDNNNLSNCKIFATNSLDEYIITELERQNAAIDAYGVGDAIATSKHNPCFGNVYKLVEIDNQPVLKRSEDITKLINPGFQTTYRIIQDGIFSADITTLQNDSIAKKIESLSQVITQDEFDFTKQTIFKEKSYTYKKLQNKVIEKGTIIAKKGNIDDSRNYYLENLKHLNETQVRLINPHHYKNNISDNLYDLKYNIINDLINQIKNIDF